MRQRIVVLPTFASGAPACLFVMTSVLISFLLWILQQGAPNRIAERNRLKQEAERAYVIRDFSLAATLYRRLAESALIPEPAVLFNQAQASFVLNDTLRARTLYARLTRISDPATAAAALSQLGVLACRAGDTTQALDYFQRALRVAPAHATSRYNFELLSKTRSSARPNRPEPGTPKTAEARANAPKSPIAPRALRSDRREDVLKKLGRHDLSPEKAQMLLDAMRAEEIQYIQQRRRTGAPGDESGMTQTW